MEVTLFGEETIVQLERVGEIKDAFVGPGRDCDGDCRIKSQDREFEKHATRGRSRCLTPY